MRPIYWLVVIIILLVAGAILHLPWLSYFASAAGVIFAISYFWRKFSLNKVQYQRKFVYHRGFPGETTPAKITVENRKLLPVSWLTTRDSWSAGAPPLAEGQIAPSHLPDRIQFINSYSLRWNQRVTRATTIQFKKRGIHTLGPVVLESGDLFGFEESSKTVELPNTLTVYPEIIPLSELGLDADDPFGDRKARRRLFEDPNRMMGVRQYGPEDEFRRIHWPATARTGTLQVKIYQPVTSQVMQVCLNMATGLHSWEGVVPETVEQLIKVAATIVYHGVEAGYAVGLISNGSLAQSDQTFHLQPGRSRDQLGNLLSMLAGLSSFTLAPFDSFLLRSLPKIPMGATMVIISAITTPELVETIHHIRRYRQHTTLISLDSTPPPPIQGVKIVHHPFIP
ncbi:MAG TPA: DUF58 domain-containing protein [Anaerolineaceae bacterium]|nr:DUF58 domain-containing protein [Anaerolineaceae bacterium]HQL39768.1 DUF58 domain-containing protein [Anaerolineaceae bacterium]